jgi:iron complex outermembrane receptor protein
MKHRPSYLAALTAGIAFYAGASHAQTEPVPGASADNALSLGEIVVTARKRDENLQNVPISITAISGKDLEERGIEDVGALTNSTPNLEINNGRTDGGASTAQIMIRGVGQNDFLIPNDPGVGLYVDDVYVARSSGGVSNLVDIQSIEVLRGPQGTLYGKDTIGGAVRITTAKPTLDSQYTEASVTTGSYDRLDFYGIANLPLSDDFAIRITGSSRSSNDIGHRVLQPGEGTGDIDQQQVRISGLYAPSGNWTFLASAEYTRARQDGGYGAMSYFSGNGLISALNTYYPSLDASLGLPAGTLFDGRWVSSPKADYGTGPNQDDFDTWGLSGVLTYNINPHLTLKSITAYRYTGDIVGRDGDFSPFPVLETVVRDWNGQFSQEFQLNGTLNRFTWTNGFYFIDEDLKNTYNTKLWDGLVYTPVAVDFDAHSISTLRQQSLALYGQGTYDITDTLHLTVGARGSQESKHFYEDWYFLVQPRSYTCPGIDVTGKYDDCRHVDNIFTPMATLSFNLTSNLMVYGSYSDGFKAGGWTPRLFSQTSLARYQPEKLRAYELGVKSDWFDRRLILNADVFYSDYRDLQLTEVLADASGAPQPVVENAGHARIYGVELDSKAKLTSSTTVELALGTLDTKYLQLLPGVQQSIHLNYNLPDAPPLTVNLALEQDLPVLPNGALISARVDANYKGRTYKEPDNSPYLIQDPYTLLNARVAYTAASRKWELSAFATNLTNKLYLTNGEDLRSTFGFVESYYGRPREAGLSFKIHF